MRPAARHHHRLNKFICPVLLLLVSGLIDLTSQQAASLTTSAAIPRNNFLPHRQQQQPPSDAATQTAPQSPAILVNAGAQSSPPRRSPLSDKENNLRLLAEKQKPKIVADGLSKRSESALLSRQYDSQEFNLPKVPLDNKFVIKRDSAESSPVTNYYDDPITTAPNAVSQTAPPSLRTASDDICSDRLCFGLPMGCLDRAPTDQREKSRLEATGSHCSTLVTSKRLIDPYRPAARDIYFEIVALPVEGRNNYAAVGFSESGRMSGLVSECIQYRDGTTQLQVIKLSHSFNLPGRYVNVPVTILSGIKNLGVSYENGYYQCRWVVESAVEFTYEDLNGTVVEQREDLGYRNYHILLASGEYSRQEQAKQFHSERASSMVPVSLAQTGHVKSLGAHILIRIHGSLMVVIWCGLVTVSVFLARYYKNEWSEVKINDLAVWFVVHRSFMLIAWFGSLVSVIFAYMYTETYHPGLHQISGTTCLILSTIQVLGGLCRPSIESSKRIYFNWTHFICGNLSYLFAIICLVTAAYLAPAHLPPIYMWIVAAFVAVYALTHIILTIQHSSHQYVVHKSSKISFTSVITVIIYLLLLLLLLSTVIGTT